MQGRPELELDSRLTKDPQHSRLDLAAALRQANAYRQNLESLYNQVTDAAVMDSIIHQMIVAEQNYNQLLQRAKAQALTNEEIPLR